jgi:hypothetical protein
MIPVRMVRHTERLLHLHKYDMYIDSCRQQIIVSVHSRSHILVHELVHRLELHARVDIK